MAAMTQPYPAPGGYPPGYPGPPGFGPPPPGYGGPPGYPPPGAPPGVPGAPPREKRQFSMWAGYVMFLSPRLWRDVGQRWGGIGFWFSFFLLLLAWVPPFVKLHVEY